MSYLKMRRTPVSARRQQHTIGVLALMCGLVLAACNKPAPVIGSFAPDTKAQCLPAIVLTNQYGKQVSLASLKGKPVLVDFFYTRCTDVCPALTARMREIANMLGPELGTKVTLISVSVDPLHDHPSELLKYAKNEGAARKGWLFLTGTGSQIDAVMARFKLKRHVRANGTIGHVPFGFLLNQKGHEIRMYDALQVKPKVIVSDIKRAVARG